MFTKVPSFYGFDDADKVTDFFIHHIEELSEVEKNSTNNDN